MVDADEEPGRGNVAKLAGLRPAFAKDGAAVTAGNASSLNDGAAAVVLMSADEAKRRGLTVLARMRRVGLPRPGARVVHHRAGPGHREGLRARRLEAGRRRPVGEINEAFSVVSIANNQLLNLDPAKVNIWGGAVALGHPIGASGTRIVVTLLSAMAAQGAKTGGASLCIGGGEGIALLLERP